MPALKDKYRQTVIPRLMETLGFKNPQRVPRLTKVVVNMGFGIAEKDAMKAHTEELTMITGQKPVQNKARKSISNFKLRQGMIVGAKVTLRGDRMYEFLERLISAALPRIRDFRGLSVNAFDGRGNYTFGVREQTIFPEIDPDKAGPSQGMDITLATTARDDKEALELLKLLGIPFARK
jgi:large subunit ribosomal protein L5